MQALKGGWGEKVQLATKFGVIYRDENSEVRGDPEYVRAACEGSLKRLGVDCINLYYQHRIDTKVPIEVTVSLLSLFAFSIFLYSTCAIFLMSKYLRVMCDYSVSLTYR